MASSICQGLIQPTLTIPTSLVRRIVKTLGDRTRWPSRLRSPHSSPIGFSDDLIPRPVSALLSQLDMDGFTLLPRSTQQPSWSPFSWRPTSIEKAVESEHRLLSQFLNIRFTGSQQPKAPEPLHPPPSSTSSCTARTTAAQSAANLVPTPLNPLLTGAELGQVQVGPNHFINTLVLEQTWQREQSSQTQPHSIPGSFTSFLLRTFHSLASTTSQKPIRNLVMTHGYGAGLGFFYRNYPTLAQVPGYRVFAIDWLGMANSSRPNFPSFAKYMTEEEKVEATESFFVDSLETWRAKMGLEKIVLMGHSMGGYLSAAYALKHPDRVEKLLLVSPVGVPTLPPKEDQRPWKGILPTIARNMWQMNITPMSVIRTLGPLGPSLVKTYTSRRFDKMDPAEVSSIDAYIYHISAQTGSGEFALAHLLAPGAWAYSPLHNRLSALKMPVSFIYGTDDWMNFRFAMLTAPTISTDSRVSLIKDAGHHMYFDNPSGFDNSIIAEMSDLPIGPYSVPEVEYVYMK
ncbi:hypothetical protein BSLG_006369 [Batrachochytrium salamandrivorans]|nr:hypothetical protein BSLG_006369 [Batrachochytrium salamandrivorans]